MVDAIIERILEIDGNAREIVKDAEAKTSDSEAIIAAEKARLRDCIAQESAHRAETVRQRLLTKAQEEAKLHEESSKARIARLETQSAAHTEDWVSELYRRITEGGQQ